RHPRHTRRSLSAIVGIGSACPFGQPILPSANILTISPQCLHRNCMTTSTPTPLSLQQVYCLFSNLFIRWHIHWHRLKIVRLTCSDLLIPPKFSGPKHLVFITTLASEIDLRSFLRNRSNHRYAAHITLKLERRNQILCQPNFRNQLPKPNLHNFSNTQIGCREVSLHSLAEPGRQIITLP